MSPTGDFKNDAFLQVADFLEDALSDIWWQNSGHRGRLPQFLRSVGSPQCLAPLAMLKDVFPLNPQARRSLIPSIQPLLKDCLGLPDQRRFSANASHRFFMQGET
jgi:hypothetical protein